MGARASVAAAGTQAQQLWLTGPRTLRSQYLWSLGLVFLSMWNPPGPGIKPVSSALADGFLSTVPPGKPLIFHLNKIGQFSDTEPSVGRATSLCYTSNAFSASQKFLLLLIKELFFVAVAIAIDHLKWFYK